MPSTSVDKPPFNEYVSITEVCEILDSRRKPVTKANRIPGPYPYYGATGVQDWVDSYIFDEPLVLIAEDCGNFGFRNQVAYKVAGKCWVNNHAHVLRPLEGFDIDFLVLALNNLDYSSLVNGTTRKKLNLAALKKIFVPRIPIREQKVISSRFLNIKTLIRKCELIQDKLDQLIKSRFIEMFGDPVLNTKNWPHEEFRNNVELINGRAYKQSELLHKGKYKVLRVGNFFSNSSWYYSDLELEEKKYCDKGDLLYAWSASFGPRIWNETKTIFHYHIWKIEVKDHVYDKRFLCYLLKYAEQSFIRDVHGIGMFHLTKAAMEQTRFIVPPLSLQNEFADFVAQVDKSQFVTLSLRYYNRGKMKWSVG